MRLWKAGSSLFFCAIVLACSGGKGSSPAEPTRGRTLLVQVALFNDQFASTIQEITIAIDQAVIARFTSVQGEALASLVGRAENVAPGTHELVLTIVRQTRSPSRYILGGEPGVNRIQVFDTSANPLVTIALPSEVRQISTGQSVRYPFTVP